MLKSSVCENGFFSMIWIVLLLIVLIDPFLCVVACIRESKQAGTEWDFADKYAANEFGE